MGHVNGMYWRREQIAIKVSTNSFFGFLSVMKNGMRPHRQTLLLSLDMVASVLPDGQDYLKEMYNATVIYGDTDSCIISLPCITDSSECKKWIDQICNEITGLFPEAIVMKPECCVKIGCKKKKYAYVEYEDNGS